MINYAEDLAYWYLRFNGFFLLRNFVLHRASQAEGTAESDLLAIRFPYVYEEIGGQENDWDREQFKNWEIKIDEFNLAFIVEVTSRRNVNCNILKNKFSCNRLEKAVQRFGIFPSDEVSCIVKKLYQEKHIKKDSWIIAKLAVTENNIAGSWLNLLLDDTDKFIRRRIKSYLSEKNRDRIHFPDALIQYLAWKKK